jgi:hypothetical protein
MASNNRMALTVTWLKQVANWLSRARMVGLAIVPIAMSDCYLWGEHPTEPHIRWTGYGVGLDADSDKFAIGSTVNVVFEDPRTGLGVLASTLSEILRPTRYRLKEPKDYFLIDSKFAKNDGEIPGDVQKYRQVLRLIELLKQAAAFLDSDEGVLVFVHGGEFELPIEYGVKDLRALDDAAIEKLLTFVGNDAHVEKKLGILEGATKALLENWPKEQRFIHLISNLPQLAENERRLQAIHRGLFLRQGPRRDRGSKGRICGEDTQGLFGHSNADTWYSGGNHCRSKSDEGREGHRLRVLGEHSRLRGLLGVCNSCCLCVVEPDPRACCA